MSLTQDGVEITTAFNSYFVDSVKVLTQNPSTGFLGSEPVNYTQPFFIIKEVSESEINKLISSIKVVHTFIN